MTVWNGDRINGHKVETTFSRNRMGEAAQRLIDEGRTIQRTTCWPNGTTLSCTTQPWPRASQKGQAE